MKRAGNAIWIVLGFLCLGLGTMGIVLPILPTVPFYMATVFCFAKALQNCMTGSWEPNCTKSIWTALFRTER